MPGSLKGVIPKSWERQPILIALLTLLALTAAFVKFLAHYDHYVRSEARSHIGDLLEPHWDTFSRAWDRRILLLEGLRGFAESNLDGTTHEMGEKYSQFAAVLYRQAEGLRCLSIAPGGTVAFVYPIQGNEMFIGHDFLGDQRPGARAAVAKTLATGEIALAGPYVQLTGGKLTFEAFGAIHGRDGFWGMVSSAIDVLPLLKLSGFEGLSQRLALAFRSLDGTVFWGDPSVFQNDPVVRHIESFGQILEVGALPLGGWRASVPKMAAVCAVGIFGILFVAGAAYLYSSRHSRLVRTIRLRTAELAHSHERFQESEKRAEEALSDREAKLRSIFSAASVGIGLTVERVFHEVNDAFCRMTGYSREELIGQGARMLYATEEDYQFIGHEKRLQIAECGLASIETRWQTKDGTEKEIAVRATPLDINVPDKGHIFTALDISERRREQEEKEKLESQLIQAQKMESIGRLAGGVAHDFNNMLSVILGCTELIKARAVLDGPSAGYLQEIAKAAHRSRDITRQLLAFSRKQIIAPKILRLNDHINETHRILSRMIGEDLHLHFLPGKDLWTIKLDPFQLDQILMNLAVNARDAMPDGGTLVMKTANVAIDTKCLEKRFFLIPGEYVLLEITDEGSGMDHETLSHLFEPFFTTKKLGQGTGLGLATVFGIVKQNNGFINAYSEPGLGTCFRVYFPRTTGEETSPASEEVQGLKGSGTVLLVEDSKQVCELIAGILEEVGFTVLVAETPSEALSLCVKQDVLIDILVTDVIMPNMNGAELGNKVAAMRPGIKILFMSGYPEDFIVHRGILKKGVDFIQKPFSMKDIADKIHQIIRRNPHPQHSCGKIPDRGSVPIQPDGDTAAPRFP